MQWIHSSEVSLFLWGTSWLSKGKTYSLGWLDETFHTTLGGRPAGFLSFSTCFALIMFFKGSACTTTVASLCSTTSHVGCRFNQMCLEKSCSQGKDHHIPWQWASHQVTQYTCKVTHHEILHTAILSACDPSKSLTVCLGRYSVCNYISYKAHKASCSKDF